MNRKKDVNEILNEIETNFDIAKLKINDLLLWPHLRYFIANALLHKTSPIENLKKKINKLKIIKNAFYGFLNIFKKSDILFFSTSKERKFEGNLSISKNINEIYKKYSNALLVEHAFGQLHFDLRSVSEKNIISLSLIELLSLVLRKIKILNYKLIGTDIVSSINQKYGLNFDLASNASKFITDYYLFKLLLKFKKPKIIYITVWYGYGPVVKAAKDLGIKTVEIQHGGIGKDHYSYNMHRIIDSSHYPEYILTFSKREADFLNRQVLKKKNIFKATAVGSFLENKKINLNLNKEIFKRFKFIVSMSATINDSEKEYNLLLELSKKLKEIMFIYIPRRENNFICKKNLFVAKTLTFSDYIPISDLHLTVCSTCMYEAAFYRKKTLIYTPFIERPKFIDNLKKELCKYPSVYRLIEENDNLGNIIRYELKSDPPGVKELKEQNLYEKNYKKNIENFVKKISEL